MTWRDDPNIIWYDALGARLRMVEARYPGWWRFALDGTEDADEQPDPEPHFSPGASACEGRCLPSTSDDWCGAEEDASDLTCSLPKGHPGDHIACSREEGEHVIEVWGNGSPDPEPTVTYEYRGERDGDEWGEVLAAALEAGDAIEIRDDTYGWEPTRNDPANLRKFGGYGPYRIVRTSKGGDQ